MVVGGKSGLVSGGAVVVVRFIFGWNHTCVRGEKSYFRSAPRFPFSLAFLRGVSFEVAMLSKCNDYSCFDKNLLRGLQVLSTFSF
jgi:hypothetical protein